MCMLISPTPSSFLLHLCLPWSSIRLANKLKPKQTRQKLKEAYTAEFLATIERAEKQVILARHGLRLLNLLDDTPIVPGDSSIPYTQGHQARQILNDAEDDLRDWQPTTTAATYAPSNSPPAQHAQPQAAQPRTADQQLQQAPAPQQQLNEKELDGASLTGTETNTTAYGSVMGGNQLQTTAV